jgi:hypothetical protein
MGNHDLTRGSPDRRAGLDEAEVPGRHPGAACDHGRVRFVVTIRDGGRGRVVVPVPFDPDDVWGDKPRHHVTGTINGHRYRSVVGRYGDGWGIETGSLWACGAAIGDEVEVHMAPEGPQRGDLADDLARALADNPTAGAFFDGLAQFYRKGYLRWIDATKRSPAERARRIAKTIVLLSAGVKDYRQATQQ